jgi:hypothetical protein
MSEKNRKKKVVKKLSKRKVDKKLSNNYEIENIGNIGQKAQLAKLPQCLHHRKT